MDKPAERWVGKRQHGGTLLDVGGDERKEEKAVITGGGGRDTWGTSAESVMVGVHPVHLLASTPAFTLRP